MMLTGNADQQTAVDAVNQGAIFRFYSKPCSSDILAGAVDQALKQYELITSERVLLERTLAGSVKVLVDVLTLFEPDAFAETVRMRQWINDLAKHLKLRSHWELDVAAMLSPIGRMTLPTEITEKIRTGGDLTKAEEEQVASAPEVGKRLIANIPRLEAVSNMIYYRNKGYDGTGFPFDNKAGKEIPIGARILKIVGDLAEVDKSERPSKASFDALEARKEQYDPEILAQAREFFLGTNGKADDNAAQAAVERSELKVSLDQLQPNDRTVSQIVTSGGVLILSAGHALTQMHIERLRSYAKTKGVQEPIHVSRATTPEPERKAS